MISAALKLSTQQGSSTNNVTTFLDQEVIDSGSLFLNAKKYLSFIYLADTPLFPLFHCL